MERALAGVGCGKVGVCALLQQEFANPSMAMKRRAVEIEVRAERVKRLSVR